MTNVIKNNIPNTVTCLNLFSGCIACVMAFEARYDLALLFIVLSAVFDFFRWHAGSHSQCTLNHRKRLGFTCG